MLWPRERAGTHRRFGVSGVRVLVAVALTAAVLGASTSPAWASSPPGRQSDGYGSTAGYVSAGATRFQAGNASDGSKVWWWVPSTLRDGASAPVVVYLHGFSLTDPAPYQPHIDHLTRQGFIVVYPQFNLTGLGIFSDNNQNVMLSRAIAATRTALASLGAQAGPLHLFGHSLGGLLSASWMGAGGPAVESVTLANPSTGGGAPSFVTVVPIDWGQAAPATTARTMILTGDQDTIAPSSESLALFGALTGASSRVVYQAHTDRHGTPGLDADHMSPIQSSGGIPNFLLAFFGGTAEQDAMDWRYYWAALDANLDGQPTVTHQLGAWSDGVAVAAPSVLASDVPDPSSAIAGTVAEAGSGSPLGGAFVAVLDSGDFSVVAGAVADGAGNYSAAVAPGSYYVYVVDPSGAHTAGFYGPPTPVTVTTGQVADVDPALASLRGSVRASVVDAGTGDPLSGVWGLALSTSSTNVGAVEQIVDADGAGDLTLSGLAAGTHVVGFVDPAGAHTTRFWPNSPTVPGSTPVAVTAGGATVADAALPAQVPVGTGAAITGTVTEAGTGAPVAGARVVALREADYQMVRGTAADANGAYRLDLAPGGYKLAVLDGAGLHAMEWYDNQPSTGLGAAATVTAPATVDVALSPTTGSIAGTVTDEASGDPIAGSWVIAIGPSGIAGGAVTDAGGDYTISGLAPGTYRATFVDPIGGRAQEYHDNSPDYPGATPFAVTAGAIATVDAALARP